MMKILKKLEEAFQVSILPRGNYLKIDGQQQNVENTDAVLKSYTRAPLKTMFWDPAILIQLLTFLKIIKLKNQLKHMG